MYQCIKCDNVSRQVYFLVNFKYSLKTFAFIKLLIIDTSTEFKNNREIKVKFLLKKIY